MSMTSDEADEHNRQLQLAADEKRDKRLKRAADEMMNTCIKMHTDDFFKEFLHGHDRSQSLTSDAFGILQEAVKGSPGGDNANFLRQFVRHLFPVTVFSV